ncbi:nuclease-related domain-containing protein [Mesobacillus subterraneus]|nr:nuclease-related domain-containing protein [Mesobacillus subterraneus]
MFKKERTESEELRVLRALNFRMDLKEKDKQYYANLLKGYEGEVMFDEYLRRLQIESLVLNDMLLELNHSHFQIDSLLISQEYLHLFEVKNFEGEFYFEDGKFKMLNGTEVKNPLLQLNRNESLFRQLLNSYGVKIPIRTYLIFINPEFTLYQAPLDRRIIMPTNLNRTITQLNNEKSALNLAHDRLSEKLLSSHIVKSPFSNVPQYEYSHLSKGVFCTNCGTVMEVYHGQNFTCKSCTTAENTRQALIRQIQDYKILFPHNKISTNVVYEWCGGVFPKKTIRHRLQENFSVTGHGQWSYYE